MITLKMLAATCIGGVMLGAAPAVRRSAQLGDDPILAVIDLAPVLDRHRDLGNALGLAFDPQREVFYLGHSGFADAPNLSNSIPRSFIYTLDLQGNVLNEFDFEQGYFERTFRPGAAIVGLSHDPIAVSSSLSPVFRQFRRRDMFLVFWRLTLERSLSSAIDRSMDSVIYA